MTTSYKLEAIKKLKAEKKAERIKEAEDLKAAQEAAAVATSEYIKENGENPMGCGFAWLL